MPPHPKEDLMVTFRRLVDERYAFTPEMHLETTQDLTRSLLDEMANRGMVLRRYWMMVGPSEQFPGLVAFAIRGWAYPQEAEA